MANYASRVDRLEAIKASSDSSRIPHDQMMRMFEEARESARLHGGAQWDEWVRGEQEGGEYHELARLYEEWVARGNNNG